MTQKVGVLRIQLPMEKKQQTLDYLWQTNLVSLNQIKNGQTARQSVITFVNSLDDVIQPMGWHRPMGCRASSI